MASLLQAAESLDPRLAAAVAIFQCAFYVVAIGATLAGIVTYRRNSARERSRWVASLYEKFFERNDLTPVREALDSPADSEEVRALVKGESAELTDYLNFFEFVCYLIDAHQVDRDDIEALFDYYLTCLRRHPIVRAYVRDPELGYERLRRHLEMMAPAGGGSKASRAAR